jgi:threonine aldolase
MADDHARARALAEVIVRADVGTPLHPVESNIVQFAIAGRFGSAAELVARARERGLLFFATGPRTARLVTHLDLDDDGVRRAEVLFGEL